MRARTREGDEARRPAAGHGLGAGGDGTTVREARGLVMMLFHGDSLAHTVRPMVIAEVLQRRGYRVEMAGRGRHTARVVDAGYQVHDLETMPQSRMDEYVSRGEYGYYDWEWIDRCVTAECQLVRSSRPDVLVADLRPTARVTAALEGIDLALVEAAYNSPGYPYRIEMPSWFGLEAGPFDEYLKAHDEGVAVPLAVLRLLADVPAFHPVGPRRWEGAVYVGPLLETPEESGSIPILEDAGWDVSRPLIWLNLGSTGLGAQLGPALVEELRHSFRVLATTASQWQTPDMPNVRVVPFLPASQIAKRADVLVGVGGIGTIYQALREGVPVVGAPEHLDQEYHLNRIRDLGLGLKLEWSELCEPERVRVAAQEVLQDERYGTRARAFAPEVRRWQGGEVAAKVIDEFVQSRQDSWTQSVGYRIGERAFVRYLELSTPPELHRRRLRHMLRRGRKHGLPWRRRGLIREYDLRASWNWLYDHEPEFFESDWQATEARRQAFLKYEKDRIYPRPDAVRFRVTYSVTFTQVPRGNRPGWRLYLPYPIPTAHQPQVELMGTEPPDLAECLLPGMGFFYGYEVPAIRIGQVFSYTCALTRYSVPTEGRNKAGLSLPDERTRYLEVDDHLGKAPFVRRFLEETLGRVEGSREQARALYDALASTHRFAKTKGRCQCPGCCTKRALSETGGHCITLARAYVALCRLCGLPSREVTGALAGYPVGEGVYDQAALMEPLFGHTWAEVWLEDKGWVPVEFHGIVLGELAMTADNVRDPAIRVAMASQDALYRDLYFGSLDSHRFECSNAVKELPLLTPIGEERDAAQSFPQWECRMRCEQVV